MLLIRCQRCHTFSLPLRGRAAVESGGCFSSVTRSLSRGEAEQPPTGRETVQVQAVKVGEFLMDAHIDSLIVSPAERAVFTASQIAKCQSLTGDRAPRLQLVDELADITVGAFSGRLASEVRCRAVPHPWRSARPCPPCCR